MPGLKETVRVFVENRPSMGALLDSRRPTFDRIHAVLPSTATTGEPLTATVQAWDAHERLFGEFAGSLELAATDPDASLPVVDFSPADEGVLEAGGVVFETPGTHYLQLTHGASGRTFVSNPVRVTEDAPERRVYWGDIHLHSQFSDGAGSIEKGMRFGRDVMALDVVAYTDHDTMGFFIPPQLQRRRMNRRYFGEMKDVTDDFHDPGSFVTLFGYEWTKQPNKGGHINVYFDTVEGGELFDSLSRETNTYEKLWARLRQFRQETDHDVLTIPHHPAEAMYPFDFEGTAYDDELAPLVEVYSQWGSSERPGKGGNSYPLAMGQGEIDEPGYYTQDAHELGYRVGLMASSDFHGPAPGHSLIHAAPHFPRLDELREDGIGWGHIWRVWAEKSYPGGLTAFLAPELTRESVFESLRTRSVYGTTQPHRILVDFAIDGVALGENDSEIRVDAPDAQRTIRFEVAGTAPIEHVTVVKNNEDWHRETVTTDSTAGLDSYVHDGEVTDDEPITGMQWDDDRGTDADTYYLRVRQTDGGMAWAGPLWVEPT